MYADIDLSEANRNGPGEGKPNNWLPFSAEHHQEKDAHRKVIRCVGRRHAVSASASYPNLNLFLELHIIARSYTHHTGFNYRSRKEIPQPERHKEKKYQDESSLTVIFNGKYENKQVKWCPGIGVP